VDTLVVFARVRTSFLIIENLILVVFAVMVVITRIAVGV